MKLTVLNSSSAKNGYILHNDSEALVIEAGCSLLDVKKVINFDINKVKGLCITHKHFDHSKYIREYISAGINVIASEELFEAKGISLSTPNVKVTTEGKGYKLGEFKVYSFPVQHDVECQRYVIEHPEAGKILFLTDTFMLEYQFPGLNHILIEANYSDEIIDRNTIAGHVHPALRARVLAGHMELETCKTILKSMELTNVMNIVLLHLSDGNADEQRFVSEVQAIAPGKSVYAAKRGLEIEINKEPY